MYASSLRKALALVAAGALFVACSGSPDSGFAHGGSAGGSGGGNGSSGGGGGGSNGGSSGSPGTFGSSSGTGSSSGGGSGGGGGPIGPVDVTPPCDTGLAVDGDAFLFAKSIGICTSALKDGYGIINATYQNAFGSSTPPAAGQWGLLPAFGGAVKPREGSMLSAISSGFAREWDDATGTNAGPMSDFVAGQPMDGMSYPTGSAPPGFPKAAQGCPQDNLVNDMVDVKLVLKAPMDASGFQFDFDFFSSEWPNYVCSNFNDAFIAYLTSSKTTDNISFDSKNNPVAVNISFLDRCTPGAPVGCLRSNNPTAADPPLYSSTCGAGTQELQGTGYGDSDMTQCDPSTANNVSATLGASTGWLTTTAPVQPGEQFTLEFMIWDAGDGLLDSSVLIDHFQWLGGQGQVTTGTNPAPAQ
ncbi:MAG TPA: choice-of-anchor L domain-containing protein [Polyangiaceae bacterium]